MPTAPTPAAWWVALDGHRTQRDKAEAELGRNRAVRVAHVESLRRIVHDIDDAAAAGRRPQDILDDVRTLILGVAVQAVMAPNDAGTSADRLRRALAGGPPPVASTADLEREVTMDNL